MTYFVTGATGFLGQHLVKKLLKRRGDIHVLVRSGSKQKIKLLTEGLSEKDKKRIIPVTGDLTKPMLGVSPAKRKGLKGKIRHVFHLAAVYDLKNEDKAFQIEVNVAGTRNTVKMAEAIGAKCFHHVSSIAAAGQYEGVWREDMFEEWKATKHPYFLTKHDSEAAVRAECQIPWRVYRPAMVVGHSKTGYIDKIDGPYYFFQLIKKLRYAFPGWFPMIGIEGGKMNVVPVDYVTDALDHIAHKPGLNGKCFHLTNPEHNRIGQLMNLFAKKAAAPAFSVRFNAKLFSNILPKGLSNMVGSLPPVKRIIDNTMSNIGMPRQAMEFINWPTSYDNREAKAALKGSGITCPPIEDYADTLWDYWERNLDPAVHKDRSLAGAVKGARVLVTGGSSGIGKATAEKLVKAGAHVIICARRPEELAATKKELDRLGGHKLTTYEADLTDLANIDKLVKRILKDFGGLDILVNNAGRSIRRSVRLSYDRFHDFERTMQLNYFGALRLIMGFLPGMAKQKRGQIVNISSIGVQVNQPRFSAYVASKAALDAFSRCAAPEYVDRNVHFTEIYMPLVRTPMIAPTKMYDNIPTLSPEEAADMVCDGIVGKKKRVATKLGTFGEILWALAPRLLDTVFNTSFKLFPDSAAAKGDKADKKPAAPDAQAMIFAQLTRGVHW